MWGTLKSFFAQQDQRIERESALRGNPGGEQAEKRHDQDGASQHQRIARRRLINDGSEYTTGEDPEEQTCC